MSAVVCYLVIDRESGKTIARYTNREKAEEVARENGTAAVIRSICSENMLTKEADNK
jgi:hypothetical protein